MDKQEIIDQIDNRADEFRRRFLIVVSTSGAITCVLFAAIMLVTGADAVEIVSLLLGVVLIFVSLWLALKQRVRTGGYVFIVGAFACFTLALLFGETLSRQLPYLFFALTVLAASLIKPKAPLVVGGASSAVLVLKYVIVGGSRSYLFLSGSETVAAVVMLMLTAVIIFLTSRQAERNLAFLEDRTQTNTDQNREVLVVASRLGAASGEIQAMMREQTQAAMSQSSAVEETRQVLRSVADSSGEIVEAAEQALENARVTYENSERVAQNVKTLSGHTQDILGMLESIKEVADRSDLLALNASLEGAKAGEVGRGFSLVANQMQRLAERVANAALDIQELTVDIRQATSATQLSMEEAMKLASATTEASQKISLITQQQRSGVNQVSTAMDDIVELTSQVASGTEQTITSTNDLQDLAEKLMELVRETKERESLAT